jgi:peptidoglycan hydrolase-like amidase
MSVSESSTSLENPACEPELRVGLADGPETMRLLFEGRFRLGPLTLEPGAYELRAVGNEITLLDAQDRQVTHDRELRLLPDEQTVCSFTLPENSIGRDFHWQRNARQTFRGALSACCFAHGVITLINHIGLEDYLEAVICSEMSPSASGEFLKAHCVISRSWVLAQLKPRTKDATTLTATWTDAAAHTHYDVCNDDHCQRYHGIGAVNAAAKSALAATRGEVLWSEGAVCDARFSKCCGGITEQFSTCWQDVDFSYLKSLPDCEPGKTNFAPPLTDEVSARRFIDSRPDVFCNVVDPRLLETILPDFDFETGDFFRWQVQYTQDELHKIIVSKSCDDFGDILRLEPLSRGPSGRISALRIVGSKHSQIVSKELSIRRILSSSHLYSSAFYVETQGSDSVPHTFTLHGAGWGHGVGLCQIGAAAMAHTGYTYQQILKHYFQGAELKRLY